MELTMDIIFQIMWIAIGMVLLGQLFNLIFKMNPSNMKEFREKAMNLQQRLKQAQAIGDPQLMQQLQMESMKMMREMAKKQLIPMCIRCIIFLGIFSVIGLFYGDYDNWFWVYFGFSFGFSMIILGIRHAYKKITGKDEDKGSMFKELLGMNTPAQTGLMYPQSTQPAIPQTPLPQTPQQPREIEPHVDLKLADIEGEKKPSWKEKLDKD